MTQNIRINGNRLQHFLNTLGTFGALEGGGVCRLALTEADKQGRDWVISQMKALGLKIRIDMLGNVIGIYEGKEDVPPVVMGSHIDTVATGGLYDGCYGVMAALEVIATLKDAGIKPKRPMAVAFFTSEEGVRFHPDMLGSFVFVGGLSLEEGLATKDVNGITLDEALQAIGYKGDAPVAAFKADTFLEAHIEQGPILDREGINIGVVESVQGIFWLELTITGISNHAGTTPMNMRHDAGFVAAKIAVFAREIANEIGGNQVATVGYTAISPNLTNVVPNKAVLTIDLRNTDKEALAQTRKRLLEYADEVAQKEGVMLSTRVLACFDPVYFHKDIVDLVEQEAKAANLTYKRMPSGAGHDAQMLNQICPTSMIFVPCKDGLSHNTKEYSSPKDLEAGANILLQVALKRANRP